MRFLYEAELIQATPPEGQPVRTLKYATLANLADVDLSNAEGLSERGTYQWQRGAGLSYADLRGANLSAANLKGANVTDKQLAECKSLEGATMPDGTKHP